MPKPFQIENGGPTEEQIDEITDEFFRLRVTRNRQPVLVYDSGGQIQDLKRVSNHTGSFGPFRFKDRKTLRECIAKTITKPGLVVVGLVEGNIAEEGNIADDPDHTI